MQLISTILESTKTFSPIGTIPADFSRFDELCRVAHIRHHDRTFEDRSWREWSIVADANPTSRGLGTSSFTKFCMLMDYVEHKHPDYPRFQILLTLLDNQTYRKMLSQSAKSLHNQLAREGVKKYDLLMGKESKAERAIDFDL
jgi:hypothetical protein